MRGLKVGVRNAADDAWLSGVKPTVIGRKKKQKMETPKETGIKLKKSNQIEWIVVFFFKRNFAFLLASDGVYAGYEQAINGYNW